MEVKKNLPRPQFTRPLYTEGLISFEIELAFSFIGIFKFSLIVLSISLTASCHYFMVQRIIYNISKCAKSPKAAFNIFLALVVPTSYALTCHKHELMRF